MSSTDSLQSIKDISALQLCTAVSIFPGISPCNMKKRIAFSGDLRRKFFQFFQFTFYLMYPCTLRQTFCLRRPCTYNCINLNVMSDTFFDLCCTDHTGCSGNNDSFHCISPFVSVNIFSSSSSLLRKGYISSSGADTILPSGSFFAEVFGSVF